MMVYCPFCIGNGLIYKAVIKVTGDIIYICDECDTGWKTTDITEENCFNFREIMSALGRKDLWSELSDIKPLEK